MIKRIFAYLLYVFITWGVLTAPARALDYMTPVLAGATAGATAYVAMQGVPVPVPMKAAVAGSVAIHAGIIAIQIANADPSNQDAAPINIELATKTELPNRPPNYTGPVFPNYQPIPPSLDNSARIWQASGTGNNGFGSTQDAACADLSAKESARGYPISSCSIGSASGAPVYSAPSYITNFSQTVLYSGGGTYNGNYARLRDTCATGYTYNTTALSCNLSNAAVVQKPSDGKSSYVVSGSNIVKDTLDANDPAPGSPMITGAGTPTLTVADNKGTVITVTRNSDGSYTLIETRPNADGTTSTRSTITVSAPDATTGVPSVTGTKSEQVPGNGAAAAAAAAAAAQSGTGTASGTTDVSNLATHEDVSSVKSSVDALKTGQCGGTGEPACKIDETGTSSNGPQSETDLSTQLNGYTVTATGAIAGYQAPTAAPSESPLSNLQGGTCAPVVTGGWGVVPSMSLDPCPVVESLRPLVEWMLYILAALYLWFRFNSVQSGVSE